MFCALCGNQAADKALFCMHCGGKLSQSQVIPVAPIMPIPVSPYSNDNDGSVSLAATAPLKVAAAQVQRTEVAQPEPPSNSQADLRPTTSLEPTQAGGQVLDAGEEARWLSRMRVRLLLALVAVLVLTLSLGVWHTYTQLAKRDAAIAEFQQSVSQLSDANQTFQGQVQELTAQRGALVALRDTLIAERDGLVKERDGLITQRADLVSQREAMTAERDGLRKDRDQLTAQVGSLQKQAGDLEQKVTGLEQSIGDRDRQLGQAREEGSRQQSRAVNAEAASTALKRVIQLDDAIHQEFRLFLNHIGAMYAANNRRDYIGFNAAYARADQSGKRLDALFAQRDAALAILR